MAQTVLDRYNKIISITRKITAFLGADFAKENYKMSFLTWFVVVAINVFLAFAFYSIYEGLVIKGDWKTMLQSLSVVGSALQGYSKLLTALFRRNYLNALLKKIKNIYSECQKDNDYLPTLQKCCDTTTKLLKFVLISTIVLMFIIVSFTLIYAKVTGEKVLIIPFLLPGLDPTTESGYAIYITYNCICLMLGGFGNFAGDMFLFIHIVHVPLVKDVFKIKCAKLNKLINDGSKPEKRDNMLRSVAMLHQHYIEYVDEVDKAYSYCIFVQISTSVMSILCTLFCILIKSWPGGPIYLLYCSIVFYVYCGLGNVIEKTNDDMITSIYCDILWYEFPPKGQKVVMLMLRKSQNPKTLTIAKIMPLSLNSGLQVTKCMYSFMMMLVNFLQTNDL